MNIIVNGKVVGTKEKGCALCGSTWGDYYEEVEGERLFFCCDICAKEFKNMIKEVKVRTKWDKIDEIEIKGNFYTGRNCKVRSKGWVYSFYVRFTDEGDIEVFNEIK